MPLTFRKRIKIFPGVFWNIGKKSTSVSVKIGPFSRTHSSTGRRTTSVDLPGPLGYRKTTTKKQRSERRAQTTSRARRRDDLDSGRSGNPWE